MAQCPGNGHNAIVMRPYLRGILLFVLLTGAACAAEVGQLAPNFALPTAAGTPVTLDKLRGQVVYVDFWASWCGPCRRSFPWMNDMQQKYGGKGLAIVAINVDKKRADADKFLAMIPSSFPVVYDEAGTSPAAFGVKGMPSSYLIDARGNIVLIERGFLDEHRAELEDRIKALIAAH
jgi:cytochrome c biogenesis protein CcmG, thiol:disulfide interchange protein DsbE